MIYIKIREKHELSEYKYIIERNMCGYTAFYTEKGFKQFLEVANLELNEPRIVETEKYGKVTTYLIDSEIQEKSFWNLEELPLGAKKFIGLSNGSYTECYYIHTEKGAIIFRPNPNAKEVYKPLSREESLEYGRING